LVSRCGCWCPTQRIITMSTRQSRDVINAKRQARRKANPLLVKQQQDRYRAAHPKQYWITNVFNEAKKRAARKGLLFTITKANIFDVFPTDNRCPVFGVPFVFNPGTRCWQPMSPSLDRIIPSRGYVPGNVIVVSMKANLIKSDATPDDIRKVADFYGGLT
jgi:hypothetical protein